VAWVLPAIVLAKTYSQYATVTVGFVLLSLGACWLIANWRFGMTAEVQVK